MSTELLASFLTILWAYCLLCNVGGRYSPAVVGFICALCLYVREYLGILVLFSILYYFWVAALQLRSAGKPWLRVPPTGWRQAGLLIACFMALYIWWPVRNYVFHDRFILLKTTTAGYALCADDYAAYRGWVLGWANDVDDYMHDILRNGERCKYPDAVFASPRERALATYGSRLASRCGSSFWLHRTDVYGNGSGRYRDTTWMRTQTAYWNDCNDSIKYIFDTLAASYRHRHPGIYWVATPMRLLGSTVLFNPYLFGIGFRKLSLYQLVFVVLQGLRTVHVVLGLATGLYYFRRPQTGILVIFTCFMYLFITYFLRFVEIRYMLQADVLLLALAALAVGKLLDRVLRTAAVTA